MDPEKATEQSGDGLRRLPISQFVKVCTVCPWRGMTDATTCDCGHPLIPAADLIEAA